jgi:nucleoside-diphosphate-sugar epimerase
VKPEVIVLGGKGFVGSAFVRRCRAEGISCLVADLDNYENLRGENCGLLVNADGNSKKYLAREKPRDDFRLSVESVLASLRDFRYRRYVYISSVDVYPRHSRPEESREEAAGEGIPASHYGLHKYLGELLVRHYASRWLIIRMGGVLGEGLKKNPVYDLIHGRPLRVDERSRYQYLLTDQVAEIVLRLAREEREGEIFNLCGKGTVSLKDIRSWLKKPLRYAGEDIPRERYEISTEKIEEILTLPRSRDVARKFVEEQISAQR